MVAACHSESRGPSRWTSIPTVEVRLDGESGFGRTVRFSPLYFEASAIAEELAKKGPVSSDS